MDREKVIRAWECCNPFNRKCNKCPYEKDCYHDGISRHMVADAIALLKEQEEEIAQLNRFINGFSRDAVPVVRCKDCKYYDYHNGCMSWHDVNSKNDNWYCADGERRMDDT